MLNAVKTINRGVVILQRKAQFAVLQRSNSALQVISLLAGDTHFVAIDLALNLKLGVFEHLGYEPRIVLVETLGHGKTLTFDPTSALNIARHKGSTVNVPTGHLAAQNVFQLANLKFFRSGEQYSLLRVRFSRPRRGSRSAYPSSRTA